MLSVVGMMQNFISKPDRGSCAKQQVNQTSGVSASSLKERYILDIHSPVTLVVLSAWLLGVLESVLQAISSGRVFTQRESTFVPEVAFTWLYAFLTLSLGYVCISFSACAP